MCGIMYIEQKEKDIDLKNLIKTTYFSQKGRGSEGFGYVAIHKDLSVSVNRAKTEEGIFKKMNKESNDELKAILFHHRFPTSTDNYIEATHPITIKRKDSTYYVIHNGVISNDTELYEKHTQKGLQYSTEITTKIHTRKATYIDDSVFNDSESLAYDFVLYLEGYVEKVRAKGSMAVIVLEVENESQKAKRLYYFRNYANPILKQDKKGYFKLSSENKKGTSVLTNILFEKDLQTGITTEKSIALPAYATYSGYYTGYNTGNVKMPLTTSYNDDEEEDEDEELQSWNASFENDDLVYQEDFYSELADPELQEQIIGLQEDISVYETQKQYQDLSDEEQYEYEALKDCLRIAKKEYESRVQK